MFLWATSWLTQLGTLHPAEELIFPFALVMVAVMFPVRITGIESDPIVFIHVDSIFSPVRRCAKAVEPCRVGRHTDYDRLVLEVETDGAISPREAVVEATVSLTST